MEIWLRAGALPLLAGLALLALLDADRNLGLFLAINRAAAAWPGLWSSLTSLGDTLTALCLLLLFVRRRPDIVLAVLLASLPALLISHGLKAWVAAPRPAAVLALDSFNIIGPVLRSGSFPSGHTTTLFVLAGVLAWTLRPLPALLAVLAAVLAGFSRSAVGAHWPLDVAGGMLCGWFAAWIGLAWAGRVDWAAARRFQRGAQIFLVFCALLLLLRYDSGYPLARPFERLLALGLLAWHVWAVRGQFRAT